MKYFSKLDMYLAEYYLIYANNLMLYIYSDQINQLSNQSIKHV